MSLKLSGVRARLPLFDLTVDAEIDGRVTAIFGPSGSGKTSLLDLIAGLRRPDRGTISISSEVLDDPARKLHLPPQSRRIGYLPQEDTLFPHMPVRKNLTYGIKVEDLPMFERIVDTLDIGSILDRHIGEISGGEKRRVALARALLSSPRMLLLDEPLSGLDDKLKERILQYLRRIRDEFALPMIYVTHHRGEVHELCDEVIVLDRGVVERRGTPAEAFG